MSAYLVQPEQIGIMVHSYQDARYNDGEAGWKNMVKELADANIKSISTKYENGADAETVCQTWSKISYQEYLETAEKFARKFVHVDPVQIIKYCQNYDYQSCEFDGYNNSRGYAFKEWILSNAISKLPDYDKYGWGYDEKAGSEYDTVESKLISLYELSKKGEA